ncbi:MAG TPA: hypothetical protein VEL47_06025 [Myxococcota bacterium]|nr:hypothetical protein [Myxococcota bacterium]
MLPTDSSLGSHWDNFQGEVKNAPEAQKFVSKINAIGARVITSLSNYELATAPAIINLGDPSLTDADIKKYNLAQDKQYQSLVSIKQNCIDILFNRIDAEKNKVLSHFGLPLAPPTTLPAPKAPSPVSLPKTKTKITPFNTAVGALPTACKAADITSFYPSLEYEWQALNTTISSSDDYIRFRMNTNALISKFTSALPDMTTIDATAVISCSHAMGAAIDQATKKAGTPFGL